MKTMPQSDYESRELHSFLNSKHAFFDSTKDFAESLASMDIPEQIEWIANGSYGAGACLALRNAYEYAKESKRANGPAHIGAVALHAFYGRPFRSWKKLPPEVQAKMQSACEAFLASSPDFAI